MVIAILAAIFGLETEVTVALISFAVGLAGVGGTLYAAKQGRKRDLDEAINARISLAFTRDGYTIDRQDAQIIKLEESVERLEERLDEAEEREEQCLERERILSQKYEALRSQVENLETFLQPRNDEDGS